MTCIVPHAGEFIKAFKVFDKEDSGYIAVGEIKYILTQLGERMDDGEVEELLKMANVGSDGQVNYEVCILCRSSIGVRSTCLACS